MSRSMRESTQTLTRAVDLAQQQGNTRADSTRRSATAESPRRSAPATPRRTGTSSKKKATNSGSKKKTSARKQATQVEAEEDADAAPVRARASRTSSGASANHAAASRATRNHTTSSTLSSFISSIIPHSNDESDDESAGSRTPSLKRRLQEGNRTFRELREEAEVGKKQLGSHNDQYIEDISVEFLYKPHTVTALLILIGVLLFMAFKIESSVDLVQNLRYGAGAACLFVLILGLLIFPAGPFIRPHPLVWRLAFGVGVLYEIWLIMLMFQTKDQARTSMKFFDSKLGVPIEERSYAADCSFNWQTVRGAVDMFVVSHFIGWVVKALILRDMVICWVISIQWELIEILFMHMLPNFAECWWDQWILDVALANGLGIYIGCQLAKYLEVKEYNWGSYKSIPSYLGKAKRTIMQFTPSSWTRVQWKSTSSIKRMIGVQFLIVAMHLEELNAFFLKYILWVPPECKLNLIRLIIWAFVGVPSLRQIYSYMTDPSCKRIGHQTFLSLVILLTELIVIVKFGRGEFPSPMPDNIRLGLATFLAGYTLILAFLALRSPEKQQHQVKSSKHE